jgi:hypothetical protein
MDIENAITELKEAKDIIDQLPVFGDGSPAIPFISEVWHCNPCGYIRSLKWIDAERVADGVDETNVPYVYKDRGYKETDGYISIESCYPSFETCRYADRQRKANMGDI